MLRQQLVELVAQNLVGEIDSLEKWHETVCTPRITPAYAQPQPVLPPDKNMKYIVNKVRA